MPEAQISDPAAAPPPSAPPASGAPAAAPSGNGSPAPAPVATPAAASIVAGGNGQPVAEPPPYWPPDWREKAAQHISAGDEKAYKKELKRLETVSDPTQLYASFRSMENVWATKQFVKLPGKDAKPEEIAEYHKALGVPEKPEDYLKDLKLDNGLVIGDADKPVVDAFAAIAHKAGAPAPVVKDVLNWYFSQQEQQAADLDQADTNFREEANKALKEEYGPAFKRYTNNIGTLFKLAPGGTNAENPQSLYARLMGGRTADGRIIGNDPDVIRFMASLANSLNPAGSVVEDGDQSGGSVMTEIEKIENTMRTDRQKYNKDPGMQKRYLELLEARSQIQARKTA